jgi:hypothetical protein
MNVIQKLRWHLLLASLFLFALSQPLNAAPVSRHANSPKPAARDLTNARIVEPNANSATTETGGIREVIDKEYRARYQEWKSEFLSTEIGRTQWEMFTNNPHFVLTISVGRNNVNGAATGKYKWDETGHLIAATIMLGNRIDEGFPSAVYYPVMNALQPYEASRLISGNVLAATKIAHEFGHVMKIGSTDQAAYTLQIKLVPIYNKIFLSNGYNVQDPRLVDLAKQMGGNPVEIWEDREYWGEANAMLFLRDRVARERFHCKLFNRIKRTVEEYAKPYEERFAEIAKSQGAIYSCSWR